MIFSPKWVYQLWSLPPFAPPWQPPAVVLTVVTVGWEVLIMTVMVRVPVVVVVVGAAR